MQNMSQQQYQMEEIPLNEPEGVKSSERRKAYSIFAKVSDSPPSLYLRSC